MKVFARLAIVGALLIGAPAAISAEGESETLLRGHWSFSGPFGVFDRAALRRGYQVYQEVCAACHSMKYLHFRNLGEAGGPEFSAEEVKAFAAGYQVEDGPDSEGDMFERAGKPSDGFPAPFPNAAAARAANNGAHPPDLSLIVEARAGGADYLYSLLQGYQEEPPSGVVLGEGQHYNRYYPGQLIAMAPPLSEGLVDYADGTTASVAQMSHDVSVFLTWASAPKMEERKRIGFQVIVYLAILAALLYFVTQRLWADVHKKEHE